VGIPQSNVTPNNSQADGGSDVAAAKTGGQDDEEDQKKKKGITLAQKVSRVTVLLPPKNKS
jgi:hypothetical protein